MKEKDLKRYLVENMHVLSKELTFIETEYYLENTNGSDGFIDILARDQNENYVIIELKTSKKTSRETIQEIFKYSMLLKSKLYLGDDEIRVIIVSTDWDELYAPFMELKKNVSYLVEGYLFTENQECVPISEFKVGEKSHQFSRNQLIFLYESAEKMNVYETKVQEEIKRCGIEDFILLKLQNDKSEKVIYPFAFVLVTRRCEEEKYISILKRLGWDEEEFYIYDYEGEERAVFLEECIYDYLVKQNIYDSLEISYPEKLVSVLGGEGWEVVEIIKQGIYKNEKRGKEWFIKRVTGITGENNFDFYDYCETKHKAKFKKMLEKIENFLKNKDDMYECFKNIWETLPQENVKSISVEIHNRGDIIQSLMLCEIRQNVENLPFLEMYVEFQNAIVERHIMLVAYSGRETKTKNKIWESLMKSDGMLYFIHQHTGEIINQNALIMKKLGLTYDWFSYRYLGETWTLVREFQKKDMVAFYKVHGSEMKKLGYQFYTHVFAI